MVTGLEVSHALFFVSGVLTAFVPIGFRVRGLTAIIDILILGIDSYPNTKKAVQKLARVNDQVDEIHKEVYRRGLSSQKRVK